MTSIRESQDHIRQILRLLDGVEDDLNSARNWGILDLFGGKGLSSIFKHSKITQAEERLDSAIYELRLLQQELTSLRLPSSKINAGNFNKFMDIFMDNTFSDIYTQTKIHSGLDRVRDLRRTLEDIYRDLDKI